MGKVTLILVLLLSSVMSLAQDVNKVDAKGRKQGKWQKTYPESKAFEYVGQFKDDKPVGTFYYYYPSTKTKAIIKHDEKGNRSVAFMYHENTLLLAYGIYRDQKKDSVWTHYGPSGRLSYKETYKNGKLNGKKTIYYVPEDPNDKSERVARIENYKDDVKHGEFIEYFDVGGIKSTGNYDHGRLYGKITTNHPNGKPMIIERYKYGNRHGWCFGYDESGGETGKRFFRFGRELTGKELEDFLKSCKEKGVSPND